MTKKQVKRLILFFLESIIILNGNITNEDFAESFNEFIHEIYEKDRDSLSIFFNLDKLKEYIDKKYDIFTYEQIIPLIYRCSNIEQYTKLVEDIGINDNQKINDLALLFTTHYQQRIALYSKDDSIYYPKGYPKILQ